MSFYNLKKTRILRTEESFKQYRIVKIFIKIFVSIIFPFNKVKRVNLRNNLLDYFKTKKCNFVFLNNFNVFNTPVFIISFNRLSYVKQMIMSCEKYGLRNIHIIDNHSTYSPLLNFYNTIPYKVYYMEKNYGHMVFWSSGYFDNFIEDAPYIVTDPDIEFNKNLPKNFIYEFYRLLGEYRNITKVGFALEINDLPNTEENKVVKDWEEKFWKKKLKDRLDIYNSDIDTTFALYRPGKLFLKDSSFYTGIRVAGDYTSHHLPWYNSVIDQEEAFYQKSANKSASWVHNFVVYKEKNHG